MVDPRRPLLWALFAWTVLRCFALILALYLLVRVLWFLGWL